MFSYYIEKLVSAYFDAFSAALQEIHKKQMEECEQGMKELKRLLLEEAAISLCGIALFNSIIVLLMFSGDTSFIWRWKNVVNKSTVSSTFSFWLRLIYPCNICICKDNALFHSLSSI